MPRNLTLILEKSTYFLLSRKKQNAVGFKSQWAAALFYDGDGK